MSIFSEDKNRRYCGEMFLVNPSRCRKTEKKSKGYRSLSSFAGASGLFPPVFGFTSPGSSRRQKPSLIVAVGKRRKANALAEYRRRFSSTAGPDNRHVQSAARRRSRKNAGLLRHTGRWRPRFRQSAGNSDPPAESAGQNNWRPSRKAAAKGRNPPSAMPLALKVFGKAPASTRRPAAAAGVLGKTLAPFDAAGPQGFGKAPAPSVPPVSGALDFGKAPAPSSPPAVGAQGFTKGRTP